MWLNAAKKAFHFLSSINVELWTLRSVYVRTRACMCVCDQSRNLYCSLGVSSPALLSICCNVKRFLLSYWVIGTAKSMWTQNFTVSYGNNIKELDTIDRQWQCYYKNRLHILSVKSKNTSLVCVCIVHVVVAQHYHSCFSFRCYEWCSCYCYSSFMGLFLVHTEKPIKSICVFCSFHLLAAIALWRPHLFVYLFEWPCVNVCLCALAFWFVALSF